jgi:cytidine deaminase
MYGKEHSSMPDDRQHPELIAAAVAARVHAYAKYSGFQVGAALRTSEGGIVAGANVENASYGLTQCAERVAVATAVAAGHRRFLTLALATSGGCAPCGACRQVLAEFCDDLEILLVDCDRSGQVETVWLRELLPGRFKLKLEPK